MKTQILLLALMFSAFVTEIQGQNRTVINAKNSEISDNLDLRVVAAIFGDSKNLQDFERQLNDPKLQISNLDLNNDNYVDYLRVIESVENRTHLIIIQSVLDRDLYQDIATIEVEKDKSNQIQIQVVGNTYIYGQNYIYEPVYYTTPVIYTSFWMTNYRPYYSSWSWNYYPNYYYAWNPYPVFRYRHNVNYCLNTYYSYNNYNYVNYRRSSYAVNIYNPRRSDGYEKLYPNASFARRNANVNNRYELDQRRSTRNVSYSPNRAATTSRVSVPQRTESRNNNYTSNRTTTTSKVSTPQRTESRNNNYTSNRTTTTSRVSAPQRIESGNNNYTSNRTATTSRVSASQRTEMNNNFNYGSRGSSSVRIATSSGRDSR